MLSETYCQCGSYVKFDESYGEEEFTFIAKTKGTEKIEKFGMNEYYCIECDQLLDSCDSILCVGEHSETIIA